MAVALSPSPSPTPAPLPSDQRDHEKFCRHFFHKSAQIIVQSRLGEKAFSLSQPQSSASWFNLAIKDIPEIALEAKRAYSSGSSGMHTVEISLKTSEGDSMILETWTVAMSSENRDPNTKLNNAAYNHLGLLLKSVLCVSRVTPAYKFSRRQGPESFVVCYRIHAGEPVSPSLLGQGYQTCCIGTVSTPVGSVSIKVDYRTDMTISPSNVSSISSNIMLLKSDDSKDNNRKSKSSDDSSAITSDESQEAFRIFSSDSPANAVPTGGNAPPEEDPSQRNKSPDNSSSKFRFGAFATSPKNYHFLEEDDDNDPLFNFLPQDEEEQGLETPVDEESNCSSLTTTKPANDHQEFEIFDNIFDQPRRESCFEPATAVPTKSEFGIFFKDKPDISLGLDPEDRPLDNIDAQIENFEKSLDVYSDMIKALDCLTSESEQEG